MDMHMLAHTHTRTHTHMHKQAVVIYMHNHTSTCMHNACLFFLLQVGLHRSVESCLQRPCWSSENAERWVWQFAGRSGQCECVLFNLGCVYLEPVPEVWPGQNILMLQLKAQGCLHALHRRIQWRALIAFVNLMFTAWWDGCPDDSCKRSPRLTERTGGASQGKHVPQDKGE